MNLKRTHESYKLQEGAVLAHVSKSSGHISICGICNIPSIGWFSIIG